MKKSQEVSIASPEYRRFIEQLKARVLSARLSASRAVNCDLILLYWDIGRGIVEKQQALGWGESVVEMVAADLQQAFPATTGSSPRNLRSAKQLYLAYSDPTIWPQLVAVFCLRQILRQSVAEFGLVQHDRFLAQLARENQEPCRLRRAGAWPTHCAAKSLSSVETPAANPRRPFPPPTPPSPASVVVPRSRAQCPSREGSGHN